MEHERWAEIKRIVSACMEAEASQRPARAVELCGGDTEMISEVESLLQSHQEMGDFLADPAWTPAGEECLTGRHVGPYRLCEPIAEGGMGTVYRAVRLSDFDKQVAIKLVKRGMDTDFILRRFRHERQILAGLDHPNIARLFDGGATEDGRPYLVMEYIDGVPLTDYVRQRGLRIRERLELFRTVCSAVQFAHQNLVVHRDLKAGNILVTADGAPKLLDFGIAKLLEPGADATMTSMRLMSPECASPEQVLGHPITTASDIYSLGVLLYQLLTDEQPYQFATRTSQEIARVVCEEEPRKPSVVRQVPMDLETIVLKAMRKEPGRRYASAEQLSEDIRRYLVGMPVSARRDTFVYRARKFVGRHKTACAAAALVAVSLLGGIAATLREARVAHQQAEIARAQRARAEQRFNDVRRLANSLIFEIHDSIQRLPAATATRKLLLERALQYLDSLAKESSGDSGLQRELATAYQRIGVLQGNSSDSNLGDTEAALTSFRKAIANWQAVARANPDNVIDQLEVGFGHRILAAMSLTTGRPGARAELDQAMAISARLLAAHGNVPQVPNERSIEYEVLSEIQDDAGDFAGALNSLREDLALKERVAKSTPGYPNIRNGMAVARVELGDELARLGSRAEALQSNRSGMEVYESLARSGTDARAKRELAITISKRGDILLMDARPASALESFRQSLAILEPMAKADPQNALLRQDVAGAWSNIGRALVIEGKYADGLAMLDRAVRALEQSAEQDHSLKEIPFALGVSFIWRGEGLLRAGKTDEALQSFQNGVSRFMPLASGSNGAAIALAMSNSKVASAFVRLKETQDASSAYGKALAILEPLQPAQSRNIRATYAAADVYFGLGDLSKSLATRPAAAPGEQRRRWSQAREWYRKSADALEKIPNAGGVSPQGFIYHGPAEAARAILSCEAALRHLSASDSIPNR
jgi:tetratricopeptide (TPR) repeat protein